MSKNTIRPYEMSVWTLRDRYVAVLKAPGVENKGHIEDPEIKLNVDGTEELSFKVPMYYSEDNAFIENPYWWDVKEGLLLEGMRKIKVIFNKGQQEEEVFEFVITKIEEKHDNDGSLFCEVSGSGLAFQELGKKGYKISLSEDDYYNDIDDYYDNNEEKEKPLNNINYWCDKIFENSDWDYSVQMDWAFYDGVLLKYSDISEYSSGEIIINTNNGALVGTAIVGQAIVGNTGDSVSTNFISYQELSPEEQEAVDNWRKAHNYRLNSKVYEDDYVSSWNIDEENGILTPAHYEGYKEKCRMVNESNSNIYNLTQAVAEAFGVFCRYKYYYDDNYHIIGKKVIFYNTHTNQFNDVIDLTYKYNTDSISREKDANDLCTKLIITGVEDDTSALGALSIMNTTANRSGEDYILNFDYMHNIGTIDDDQYAEVPIFETKMRQYNNILIQISDELMDKENALTEQQAISTISGNAITKCADQRSIALSALKSLSKEETGNSYGIIENKLVTYIVQQSDEKNGNANINYINISQKGVTSITLYTTENARANNISPVYYNNNIQNSNCVLDEQGYITKINNITTSNDSSYVKKVYGKIIYSPQSYYTKIMDIYAKKQAEETIKKENADTKIIELESRIEELNELYANKLAEKNKIIADFEKMMGPALREGSWQPEEYNDYGDNKSFEISSGFGDYFWDTEAFDEETVNYYTFGILEEKKYYPYIDISNSLDVIKNYISRDGLLQFKYEVTAAGKTYNKFLTLHSTMELGFIEENEEIHPVLLLTGLEDDNISNANIELCISEISVNSNNSIGSNGTNEPFYDYTQQIVEEKISTLTKNITVVTVPENEEGPQWIFPRIIINDLALKTSEDMLHIKDVTNSKILEKYYDYYLLMRDNAYYITLTPESILANGNLGNAFRIDYIVSNAELNIYLDAREVAKTNSIPQVSYEIDVTAIDKNLLKSSYKQLNRLVNINDYELKFQNVKGYISNLELKLDKPWEDEFEIKNYKTKFEDLFSKIVASTEQMKANGLLYDKAAAAFSTNGNLKASVLQETLNNSNSIILSNNNGSLVFNDNGLQAINNDGIVKFNNEGIFYANTKDNSGNWMWYSAVLPSGINASELKAGRIDTNLIKLYSGDDLKFQMNSDGLFAYKDDEQLQYVVHNKEGLFLTEKAGLPILNSNNTEEITNARNSGYKINTSGELIQDINRVSISWNGITLRNYKNDEVFFADDNTGNVTIKGTIIAASGQIAGWNISPDKLDAGSGENYVALNTSTTNYSEYAFWAGNNSPENATFSIKKTGAISIQSAGGGKYLSIDAETGITADNISAGNIPVRYNDSNIINISSQSIVGNEDRRLNSVTELQEYFDSYINNKILEDDFKIYIYDVLGEIPDVLFLRNIYGPGSITIQSNDASIKLLKAIRCEDCQIKLKFNNIAFNANTINNDKAGYFDNCLNIVCENVGFYGKNTSENENQSRGLYSNYSRIILNNCSFGSGFYLIEAAELSHIYIKTSLTCYYSHSQNPSYSTNNWLKVDGSIVHAIDDELITLNGFNDENNEPIETLEPIIINGGLYGIGNNNSGSSGGSEQPSHETITTSQTSGTASGTLGSIKNSSTWNSYVKVVSPTIPYGAKITDATVTITRTSGYGLGSGRPISEAWYFNNTNIGGGRTWNQGKTHTVNIFSQVISGLRNGNYIDNDNKVLTSTGEHFTLKLCEGITRNQFAMEKNYSDNYMRISCYITVTYEVES